MRGVLGNAYADGPHMVVCAVQRLKRKADDRNPDEFYFAMQRTQTKDGVHIVPCALAADCFCWPLRPQRMDRKCNIGQVHGANCLCAIALLMACASGPACKPAW